MTSTVFGSLIVSFIFLSLTQCEIVRTRVYTRNLKLPDVPTNNQKPFIYFAQPDIFYDEDGQLLVHVSYAECNAHTNRCNVTIQCVGCDDEKPYLSTWFLPPNPESLREGILELHLYRNTTGHPEGVIIDWASKAVVPANSVLNTVVQDLSRHETIHYHKDPTEEGGGIHIGFRPNKMRLSDRDNGNRHFVAHHHDKQMRFSYIYSDYERCPGEGWIKLASWGEPYALDCILGLTNTSLVVGTAVGPIGKSRDKEREFYVIEDVDGLALYQKSGDRAANATLKYQFAKTDHQGYLPRLSHFHSSEAIVCWLPIIEHPKSDVHCIVMGLEDNTPFTRKITLKFPYEVRDFEVDVVGSRIFALTSSIAEYECKYELREFNMLGTWTDGPVKIDGPSQCIYKSRLDPRPIVEVNGNRLCVGFTFEQFPANVQERPFSVNVECFDRI